MHWTYESCDKSDLAYNLLGVGHLTEEMWQKAHSKAAIMASVLPSGSRMLLNLPLFSDLHFCCNFTQISCDTVSVVHMHPSEAM